MQAAIITIMIMKKKKILQVKILANLNKKNQFLNINSRALKKEYLTSQIQMIKKMKNLHQ